MNEGYKLLRGLSERKGEEGVMNVTWSVFSIGRMPMNSIQAYLTLGVLIRRIKAACVLPAALFLCAVEIC